ncbi:glycosyltransferase [candidate division WOR-3 bacterium]|nr:glycosyltransferase [candidate division WOR-3 bacterium]
MPKNHLKVYLIHDTRKGTSPHLHNLRRGLSHAGVKTIISLPFALRRDFPKFLTLRNLGRPEVKVLHYIWGDIHPFSYVITKLFTHKKIIVHWMGSDVLQILSSPWKRILWRMIKKVINVHCTDFYATALELRTIGIKAKVIPLIPDLSFSPMKTIWPPGKVVFTYIPESRETFYGSKIIFALAKRLKDVEFLIVGTTGKNCPQLPNVKYLGFIEDMEQKIWNKVKGYIRITKHDGLSHLVIEALARGKYVIRSYKFPYCFYARTLGDTEQALRQILQKKEPNFAGMNYVNTRFHPLILARNLKKLYMEI